MTRRSFATPTLALACAVLVLALSGWATSVATS
jgi:hypothetical protein